MILSKMTLRFYDYDEYRELLNDIFGDSLEESKTHNLLLYSINLPATESLNNAFDYLYKTLKGKEKLIKNITSKKDIFIKVDDDMETGNIGFQLTPKMSGYLSELGFVVDFDIYF